MSTSVVPAPDENSSAASETEDFFDGIFADEGEEQFEIPADLLTEADRPAPGTETTPAPAAQSQTPGTAVTVAGKPAVPAPVDPASASVQAPAWTTEGEAYSGFRADGRVYEIPGARRTDTALIVPLEHAQYVERLMAAGVAHNGSFRQRLQAARSEGAAEALKTELAVHPEVVKSKAMLAALIAILDEGPDAVAEWLDDFQANRAKLEANATLKLAEATRATPAAPKSPNAIEQFTTPEYAQAAMTMARTALPATVTAVLRSKHFAAYTFDAETTNGIVARVTEQIGPKRLYYIQDNADDPQIALGEIVENRGAIAQAVAAEVKFLAPFLAKATQQATAAAAAIAKNTARGVGTQTPKPNATGGTAIENDAPKPRAEPKTREEFEEFYALPQDEQEALIALWYA